MTARRATFCSRKCANTFTSTRRNHALGVGPGSRGGTTLDAYAIRAAKRPGLNAHKRRALLAQWRKEGRACTYCPKPVEQVDHVVPIARGGTNYEGNLQPICSSCNPRKGKRLHIEFVLYLRSHTALAA